MRRFSSVLVVLLASSATASAHERSEEVRVEASQNDRAISHYYVYGDVPQRYTVEAYADNARVGEVRVTEGESATEVLVSISESGEARMVERDQRLVGDLQRQEHVGLLTALNQDRNLARALDGPIVSAELEATVGSEERSPGSPE